MEGVPVNCAAAGSWISAGSHDHVVGGGTHCYLQAQAFRTRQHRGEIG